MKHLRVQSSAALFAAVLLFFCSPFVSAQSAGYDLLQTGSDASIDLSHTIPGLSATPPVAGLPPGAIPLQGVPICACTGATDTIMYRTVAVAGRANLTVIALFMKNSVPVTLGGANVDVYVTINNSSGMIGQDTIPQPDRLRPSTGHLTIHSGGTFESDFFVYADIIVVAAGADVRDPATPRIRHLQGPRVHLGVPAPGAAWSPTRPAGYPQCFFPGNGFYPAGPLPEADPTNPAHRHPVVASSPISASLTATPSSYTGSCPVHISFDGTITSTVAGTVTYTFIYSDGAIDALPPAPLVFASPGSRTVHLENRWDVGFTGEGWAAIKILSPSAGVESNHATFTTHCTP